MGQWNPVRAEKIPVVVGDDFAGWRRGRFPNDHGAPGITIETRIFARQDDEVDRVAVPHFNEVQIGGFSGGVASVQVITKEDAEPGMPHNRDDSVASFLQLAHFTGNGNSSGAI